MLIDSHCHLNFTELSENLDFYLEQMQQNDVQYALCIGTTLKNIPDVVKLADEHINLFASVGVHPDEIEPGQPELTDSDLLTYVSNPKVIAIGETGLDYFHLEQESDKAIQHRRFITHINVARTTGLPLVIHTRQSIADTLDIMREYKASECGAVMHCFTENLDNAKKCLDMGFYISISGIVTFKNAHVVQEMAKYLPLDRLLIETDSPYLSPAPFRGKMNHPAQVKYTAQFLADLKMVSINEIAEATSNNFLKLFKKAKLIK